ncbi:MULTISPECIES: tautomerase PptA [Tatumella]|uniref:Tautomerase PptA n=1 Tax=Tatumella punctata TaxID=399969 RepID=A0ABW1VKR0_9GAMM|nr:MULTISPECIES: tautomerase PptA [unclassified Tatumella]MBS0855648.1 tautomerase PptA [Tatumella sp. JGM16]MBS0876629.1 tautomerase PptA [Tatumella sp. JGM82]MBS0889984.1 tautomerase PptA [Tatumella sp. JGM94]MBS0893154.1 tautomerase PptA [Tatumella sp. JGM130]MBS0901228.1 tautomerase PptA [Tatumella sp. JGM100]
MPHIEIQSFPRELTDEQKTALAGAMTAVLQEHLNSSDSAVSIALKYVPQENWKSTVWDTQIAPQMDQLIKKPGYQL